ncbi:hypothetical protein K457DRAFT_1034164 [Linnemannia elongata AG-77]|uniref:Uncharacterized protein n=1 Tax=Linnemannia elongata AG-77 TaxID=1314771 RepID=A0A197K8W7_9FUNG|nr:hypothetical protein K457DRAFT_1034164 [Linnemannia elongata AG-77]
MVADQPRDKHTTARIQHTLHIHPLSPYFFFIFFCVQRCASSFLIHSSPILSFPSLLFSFFFFPSFLSFLSFLPSFLFFFSIVTPSSSSSTYSLPIAPTKKHINSFTYKPSFSRSIPPSPTVVFLFYQPVGLTHRTPFSPSLFLSTVRLFPPYFFFSILLELPFRLFSFYFFNSLSTNTSPLAPKAQALSHTHISLSYPPCFHFHSYTVID